MCIQTRACSRLSSLQPPGVVAVAAGLGADPVASEADRKKGLGAVAEVAVAGAVVACSVDTGSVIVRRVFPGHILRLKILVQNLHTSKLTGETILSVGE